MRKLKKKMDEARRKERVFVDEYLKCWNGAMSARRAGYSVKSAYQIAYEILRKPHIKAEIEERMKQSAMSADEVLARLSEHARGNIADLIEINDEGFASFDFSTDEAKGKLHLVKKIRSKRTRRVEGRGKGAVPWEDESVEVEMYDAQRALEMLGRYHNLFTEKDEDGKPLTDEERIARVMAIYDAARARRDGQASPESS
jgi:phage terminase small subunit